MRLLTHRIFFTAILVFWLASLVLTNPISVVLCSFLGEWTVRGYYKSLRNLGHDFSDDMVRSVISSSYLQRVSRARFYADICLIGAFVGIAIMFMLHPASESARWIAGGIVGALLGVAFRFYREHVKCLGD